MKCKIILFLVLSALFGCVLAPVPVRLYATSGPLEGNVIVATVHRTVRNAGSVELTMPDGEYCRGEYSVITQGSSGFFTANWQGVYQSIYGSGYTQTMQRSAMGMGTAVGNKGTVMEVNFFADTETGHGFGAAKDNKGNIYRVQF